MKVACSKQLCLQPTTIEAFSKVLISVHCPKSKPNFTRYNMKCSGKHDTTVHELFRVVSRCPRYISCYIAENGFPSGQCTICILSKNINTKSLNIFVVDQKVWRNSSFRFWFPKRLGHLQYKHTLPYCYFYKYFLLRFLTY